MGPNPMPSGIQEPEEIARRFGAGMAYLASLDIPERVVMSPVFHLPSHQIIQ
jgi:hypothetical protein